jgi:hypothetical protein
MKKTLGAAVLLSVLCFHASQASAQTSNFVFQATLSATGVAQGQNSTLLKANVSAGNLINLALGNDPTTPIPANQVLAVVAGGSAGAPALSLIVFDNTAVSNLITIGTISNPNFASGGLNNVIVEGLLNIQQTGVGANSLIDGTLMVDGKAKAKLGAGGVTTDSITLSAAIAGSVDLSIAGATNTVIVTKGTLGVKGTPIGVLVGP